MLAKNSNKHFNQEWVECRDKVWARSGKKVVESVIWASDESEFRLVKASDKCGTSICCWKCRASVVWRVWFVLNRRLRKAVERRVCITMDLGPWWKVLNTFAKFMIMSLPFTSGLMMPVVFFLQSVSTECAWDLLKQLI